MLNLTAMPPGPIAVRLRSQQIVFQTIIYLFIKNGISVLKQKILKGLNLNSPG
jgi:hypothetical protein